MMKKPQTKKKTVKPLADDLRKSRRSADEIWDDLFATPESEAFLTMMVADVEREEAEGKLIEGGWDEI